MTLKSVKYQPPEFASSSDFWPKPSFWTFLEESGCQVSDVDWVDSIAKFVNSFVGGPA
jgi:hypothetical protein